MRLSIKALRYFLVAAEQKSIARAAELLNVVPSAISVAIDQVEEEFDLKLVQRYPAKGIQPTSTGMQMMQKVRHLIEEYDNLLSEGDELRTTLSGSLTIGYYAPVAPAFMPAIAAPLMQQNPAVKLAFVECDNERAQAGLLKGEFDCSVFVAENVRNGIEYETLLDAPPYLLVAENHPLAQQKEVTFRDLDDLPLVLLDLPFTSEYYRSLLEENALKANIVATASTTEMVRSLVGAGVGCSVLNMLPATSISYAGDRLCALPFADDAHSLRLVMGHLGGKQRRLLTVFTEACQAYFATDLAKQLMITK